MLALRVSSPTAITDDVLALLRSHEYVTCLSVIRGASLVPEGDVITADLAREGANEVVDELPRLGVHHEGSIRLDPVDTWLSQPALDAERGAPGASADAVVWAEVGNRAYGDSELNWTYLSFMILATLIAGIAIVLDSPILTIGAMVLGPEFGPLAAIGLALAFAEWSEVRGSALQLTINLGCIALAGALTLAFQKSVWGRVTVRRRSMIGRPDWMRIDVRDEIHRREGPPGTPAQR